MSSIQTTDPADATGLVADVYADDERDLGYVPAYTRVMAVDPEAYLAWEHLAGTIARQLGPRRWELVTLAAAKGVRSVHCRLAHGRKSLGLFDEETLAAIARDHHDAGLSEAEVAMMDFAERVSVDPAGMGDDGVTRLRGLGFSDREIVDIALAAAARNYYSRALQALGVDVEVPPGLDDRLRDALLTFR